MEEPATPQPVTQLLAQWRDGDERAFAQLSGIMYEELVNEAFVRLVGQQSVDWQSRQHFVGLASKLMRRVLVDYARARLANKRGGGAGVQSLDEMAQPSDADEAPNTTPTALQHLDSHTQEEVSAIDQALLRLEQIDARQSQIVEMRYFGGLTVEQTAEAMDISEATVKREWTLARAWLRRELGKSL
jgi:RNA polymerase sigma factor (TIGR02999 family)